MRSLPPPALLLLTLSLALPAAAGVDPSLVRTPYLQMATPTSMVVRWRTDVATPSYLRFGPASDQLTTTISTPGLVTDHEVPINELKPGTRYYYEVGDGVTVLTGGDSEHYFETSPLVGSRERTRIWVVGDSGQCSSPSERVVLTSPAQSITDICCVVFRDDVDRRTDVFGPVSAIRSPALRY